LRPVFFWRAATMRAIRASRSACDIPLGLVVPNELRGVTAKPTIPVVAGELKLFTLGINLAIFAQPLK
jgi:hypothetical protein